MVAPVNNNSSAATRTAVQPASTQNQAQEATGTAETGVTTATGLSPVAEEINTDHYSTGSGTDAEVSGNLAREAGAARPQLQKPLVRGLSDETAGVREPTEGAELGVGTAVPRPPTAAEIEAKYGVGGTRIDEQMVDLVQQGKKVPPELEQAKWAELRAQGFDPSSFDGAGYLRENPDVANFWRTGSGLIDPNLAAACHYQGWGRHEMRGEGDATVNQPGQVNATKGPTVDFNSMTQDQQYDYLRAKTVADAGGDGSAWKSGDRQLNLVGVRGFKDGVRTENEPDKFNDTVYACRLVDGKKEVYAFNAAVDAGIYDAAEHDGYSLSNRDGYSKGVAHLADGFYRDAWSKGPVTGGVEGLRQTGWVRVNADFNNNGKIDDSERLGRSQEGMVAGTKLQLQFHPGYGDNVGSNSLGCQSIKGEQWDKFQQLLDEVPGSQKNFSYNLTDGRTMKAPGADGSVSFQNAKYDSLNFFNEMNVIGVDSWRNLHLRAEGRGMSAGTVGGTAFYQTDGDYSLASVSGDGDGPGIIQTPYRPGTPPPPPSWWPKS